MLAPVRVQHIQSAGTEANVLASKASDSLAIPSAVNAAKAFSVIGYSCNTTPSNRPDYGNVGAVISSSTTLDYIRAGSHSNSIQTYGYIVDSADAIVERGSWSYSSSASVDIPLTTITDISKAFRLTMGNSAGTMWLGRSFTRSYLWNNAGVPTLHLEASATDSAGVVYWQVVQLPNISVQRGRTTSMATTTTTTTQTISAVALNKSFLNFDWQSGGPNTSNNVGAFMLDGYFNSTTQLEFTRFYHDNLAIPYIEWEVVSFTSSNVTVQEVKQSMLASANIASSLISAVSIGKAWVISSSRGHFGAGNVTNDGYTEGSFCLELPSSTSLRFWRHPGPVSYPVQVTAYVIDQPDLDEFEGEIVQESLLGEQGLLGTFKSPVFTGEITQESLLNSQELSGSFKSPVFTGTANQVSETNTQALSGSFSSAFVANGNISQESVLGEQGLSGTFVEAGAAEVLTYPYGYSGQTGESPGEIRYEPQEERKDNFKEVKKISKPEEATKKESAPQAKRKTKAKTESREITPTVKVPGFKTSPLFTRELKLPPLRVQPVVIPRIPLPKPAVLQFDKERFFRERDEKDIQAIIELIERGEI